MKKYNFKKLTFLFIQLGIIYFLIINYQIIIDLINFKFINNKKSEINVDMYIDNKINIDTINFNIHNKTNLIYVSGREINLEIEKKSEGYSGNLLKELTNYCYKNNYNFYYYNVANDFYVFKNGINSNEIDLKDLNYLINKSNGKIILIGLSYGAKLVEILTCKHKEIYGISIGGSLRNIIKAKYTEIEETPFYCLNNKNLINIIGHKDGQFENNKFIPTNLKIYKGFHYVNKEAINKTLLSLENFK